jgi:hypothetical protein
MVCCVPFRLHRVLAVALGVVFCFAPSLSAEEQPPAPAPQETPALFHHIVLLGASVTAGFEESEPLGGPKTQLFRFANFIEAALSGTHDPVETQASALLFFKPEETMERQIAAAVAAKPSLVVGVDALFWFCYGARLTAEQRLARFEAGLRLLGRISAPLIVGDLPDASPAVGGMLSKDEMPDPAVLAHCNERLQAWAAEHKNVAIVPLSRMMAAAFANAELTLGGMTWAEGKSGVLIRSDHLHPTRHGLAALAIEALNTAGQANSLPSTPDGLCREVETVYQRALAQAGAVPQNAK